MTTPHLTTPLPDWLASAAPGAMAIAHTGQNTASCPPDLRGDIARARDRGLITTVQKRNPHNPALFDWIVIRLSGEGRRVVEEEPKRKRRDISMIGAENRANVRRLALAGNRKHAIVAELGLGLSTVEGHLRALREAGEIQ